MRSDMLNCGSASRDITPDSPQFLYGYPHARRMSTGTHDPLLASALLLQRGNQHCLFISVDLAYVDKATTAAVRQRIHALTGVSVHSILLSATHTHSGPVTVNCVASGADQVIPPPNLDYLAGVEAAIVSAAVEAWECRRPAEVTRVVADATGIGTCRHDPLGPSSLGSPVLAVRDSLTRKFIAIQVVCAMHPTVLHQDSTLFSADFPGMTRRFLQRTLTGADCPVLYHIGAAGNQSPRHVTKGNTFAEAVRLGEVLGKSIDQALRGATYSADITLDSTQHFIEAPPRQPPSFSAASSRLQLAQSWIEELRLSGAPAAAVRTAECDVFGAEETVAIAIAANNGKLLPAIQSCLPAEIQILRVGPTMFVGWPGEFFVEFAQSLSREHPDAVVITMANGELQGYVVTQEAIDRNYYEAGTALFKSPETGDLFVRESSKLILSLTSVGHV